MTVRRPIKFARAFTLFELLLAVGIFAIILVAMNTVFYSALRLRSAATRAVDAVQPVQQAVNIIRHDLLNTSQTNGLATAFKLGSFSSALDMSTINGLQFFTTTGAVKDNEPWGDLQLVTYQLRDSTDATATGKDLIRTVTRNLLPSSTPEADDQWLMGNVASVQFDGYDGTDWQSSWDTSLSNSNLPTAVRVTIQLASNTTGQPLQIIVPISTQQ